MAVCEKCGQEPCACAADPNQQASGGAVETPAMPITPSGPAEAPTPSAAPDTPVQVPPAVPPEAPATPEAPASPPANP